MRGEQRMAKAESKAEPLRSETLTLETDTLVNKDLQVRLNKYKIALVSHDISIVTFAFGIGIWLIGPYYHPVNYLAQILALFAVCLITTAFYLTQNLYNYHHIYARRYQVIAQLKSAGLSLLTFGFIIGIHLCEAYLADANFLTLLIVMCVLILLLGRFFRDNILHLLRALGFSVLAIGIAGFASGQEIPLIIENWRLILLTYSIATGMLLLSRYFLVHVVLSKWARRRFRRQTVIIGSNEQSNKIGRHIVDTDAPFWIVGSIGIAEAEVFLDIGIEKCFLGDLNNLEDVLRKDRISDIIVTDEKIDKRTLISLLDYCIAKGVNAWFPPNLMPIIDLKLYIDNFCGIPLIRLCSQKNNWLFNKVKHGLDAVMTLPGFALLLPFVIAIAVAIKLDSKGPVFYRAEAIGQNGQLFNMFKFRSMRADTQHDIHKRYVNKLIKGKISKECNGDKPLKITNDPRVTWVGKILRKTSLDELPQLINVLKGEMSLVGPRPCLPYEYEIYKDWYKKRTSIRPGITGLWQVTGRSEVSFEDMILLDLYYIYNRSLKMDFNILYETIFTVLTKKGAY